MRRFRYARDPLCLGAVLLYTLDRALAHPDFLRGWFGDLLFIPAAAPLYLWVERRLGLRRHDLPPSPGELVFLVLIWSAAAELLAPRIFPHCTADPLDVAAYAAGALVAGVWWNRPGPGPRQ